MSETDNGDLFEMLQRAARVVREEMGTIEGPLVRARLRAGRISIESSPAEAAHSTGFSSAQAELLDGGAIVDAYIPDGASLAAGAVVEVAVGEHGYYFKGLVSSQ